LAVKGKEAKIAELAEWWKQFVKEYLNASIENKKRLKVFADVYNEVLETDFVFKYKRGRK
jgi:hypothetical protein